MLHRNRAEIDRYKGHGLIVGGAERHGVSGEILIPGRGSFLPDRINPKLGAAIFIRQRY
ncbi:MAG TPA: hypothetical protein VF957_20785 [Bradyrhizobium sp.]